MEIGQQQITEQNKQVVSQRAGGNYADKQKPTWGYFLPLLATYREHRKRGIRILIRPNTALRILIRRKATVEIWQQQTTEQNKQVVSKRA